jgi:hypothetical protein
MVNIGKWGERKVGSRLMDVSLGASLSIWAMVWRQVGALPGLPLIRSELRRSARLRSRRLLFRINP